ncbi:ROK family protein [Rubrolithibacter danxiaensis]|uniref:ROK family protein n=1 Tax=Rubrolithibacter danxiaensis TaxID=3390805 RepID=UPI003BF8AA17
MSRHYLGIEIGGTKLQLVAGDEDARILQKIRFDIKKEKGAEGIQNQLKEGIKSLRNDFTFSAAGIGFGGPVEWQTGKICVSHQIEGWSGFDLASFINSLTSCPVYMDNDANVAALGESVKGAGKDCPTCFYITLGSGVGGGLIYNGQIYHGANPGEVEIGHVRLDKKGRTVESSCSGWAVDKKIREAILTGSADILKNLVGAKKGGEAKFLVQAIEQDGNCAKEILNTTADDLAFGLSHVIHLFHPEIIIIGGGLSMLGEILIQQVEQAISQYIMKAFLPPPSIRLAVLGEDAVPVGALLLAKQCLRLQNQL